jgi:hypothetical protein
MITGASLMRSRLSRQMPLWQKPILNLFIGTNYATAYAHFAADHATPINLA